MLVFFIDFIIHCKLFGKPEKITLKNYRAIILILCKSRLEFTIAMNCMFKKKGCVVFVFLYL